jgi:hypothetical protein
MHLLTFSVFVGLAAALAPLGCQSPQAAASGGQAVSLPPLPAGRQLIPPEQERQAVHLYLNKCARCHKFYDPREYTDAAWQSWMRKMSRKAKLEPEQEALLWRYLDAFRAGPQSNQ